MDQYRKGAGHATATTLALYSQFVWIDFKLKNKLPQSETDYLKVLFTALKLKKKNDFWTLEATKAKAAREGKEPLSVEEKLMEYGESCNYHHLSQSLTIDIDDDNMTEVFDDEELNEIRAAGMPMFRDTPKAIDEIFAQMEKLSTPVEVYNFTRKVDHDPLTEHLKVYLCVEVPAIAKLFFNTDMFNIDGLLEADQQYKPWRFVSGVVEGSLIKATGKEKSSVANAAAKNMKRCLSAIDPIKPRQMGHRMDTIFTGGRQELGCIEIGTKADQTKEFHDSRLKMPLVLRDMLVDLVKTPTMLRKVQTVGYSISGGKMSMLYMDVPKGLVTRIRRTTPVEFPCLSSSFVPRLLPLLELALMAYTIMHETLHVVNNTRIPIQQAGTGPLILPPTYIPHTPTKT